MPQLVDHDVDVIVVGAGMAGLQAARDCLRQGLDVHLIEARDRVGGRSWTEQRDSGVVVDRGGQWIGPTQDRLQALADEAGIATFTTYATGNGVEWTSGARSVYDGLIPTSDPHAAAEGIEAIFELDLAAQDLPLDCPWDAPNAVALDRRTLEDWLSEQVKSHLARTCIEVAIKAIFGAEPSEMSLLFTQFYLAAGGGLVNLARTTGGAQERRFFGGSQPLAQFMANQLGDRVHLALPVDEIRWSAESATVSVRDGAGVRHSISGRRVVLAIPPAVSNHITFDPPLPANRAQLAQRIPMGSVFKIQAVYPEPFWRAEDLNGQLVSDEGLVRSSFDNSSADGSYGALVGFIAGDEARLASGLAPERRRQQVLDDLVRAFGPAAGQPVDYIETEWGAEPYSGGGPVAICPPGTLSSFGRALREPVGPLHFAGTETATQWCGYLDGALQSGERAAAEIVAALK